MVGAVVLAGVCAGCDPIDIFPTFPEETLRVGETIGLLGNPANPGSIPAYQWEVLPSTAGTFSAPNAENTDFQALREGDFVIRLTASDGFWQAVASCAITVEGVVGRAVAIEADPRAAVVGETVTLTCTSVGEVELTQLSITELEGPDVTLTDVSAGVATFVAPENLGDITFRCVGADASGELSDTQYVTVRVSAVPSTNDNSNSNSNDNNSNDNNSNSNGNDNNSNSNDNNSNSNSNSNSNDNNSNSNGNDNNSNSNDNNSNSNGNANDNEE